MEYCKNKSVQSIQKSNKFQFIINAQWRSSATTKKNTLIKIPVAVNRKRFPNITKVLVDHDVIQAELMLKDK